MRGVTEKTQRGRPLSNDAVVELYERTLDEVYRYATRLTGGDRPFADEIVQETYLQLLRGPAPRDGADIGWLIVACRHRFLDALKRDRRRTDRELRALEKPAAAPEPGGEATDALGALPVDYRVVLVLRYVDGLSVSEIATEIGRSRRATESLLARARAALRDRLTKGGTDG